MGEEEGGPGVPQSSSCCGSSPAQSCPNSEVKGAQPSGINRDLPDPMTLSSLGHQEPEQGLSEKHTLGLWSMPKPTLAPQRPIPGNPWKPQVLHPSSVRPITAPRRALGLPVQPLRWPAQGQRDTCRSGAVGADLVDLVGLRRHVPGPVIDEAEVTALVQGTAQVGLPLGWIGLVHPLRVLPCLLGPGLGREEKIGNQRTSALTKAWPLPANGSCGCAGRPSVTR